MVTWAIMDGLLYSRYSDVGEIVRRGVIAESVDLWSSLLSLRRSKCRFTKTGLTGLVCPSGA